MNPFPELPVWDLPNSGVAQLDEQSFLEFLQKQFPPVSTNGDIAGFPTLSDAIDPQNLSAYSISSLTPPTSEDSSPSPTGTNQDASQDGVSEDPTLKRKASSDQLGSEPSSKALHTSSNDKRTMPGNSSATRRKPSGQSGKDEHRLLKRKEQNRAAQRAFRERKEKHVKDLEDKVAELEASNEAAHHENENLRDMLNRLQSENITLKQSAFTFPIQKESSSHPSDNTLARSSVFSPAGSVSSSSLTVASSPKPTNPLDWSSLTTFDPNILNLLDNNVAQSTATDDAMRMDFGFGNSGLQSNEPLTIIANNPMFTTNAFDFSVPTGSNPLANPSTAFHGANTSNNAGSFFDLNALTSWPTSTASGSAPEPIFDDLFRGYVTSLTDFSSFTGTPSSFSPIAHHTSPSVNARLSSISSVPDSTPSILGSEPLFSTNTPSPGTDASVMESPGSSRPHTKAQCKEKIAQEGDSVFAPPIQRSQDQLLGTMIKCVGSTLPKTERNDRNIEVLTAFNTIRTDPKFKDVDINELCNQFTKKACCDGTKVVLEPAAVSEILDNLRRRQSENQTLSVASMDTVMTGNCFVETPMRIGFSAVSHAFDVRKMFVGQHPRLHGFPRS